MKPHISKKSGTWTASYKQYKLASLTLLGAIDNVNRLIWALDPHLVGAK